eukprot:4724-Heterococcus_DN1.PRE.1
MEELGPSISESVAECWTLASRLQDGLPRMTAADLTASLAGHPFQVQDQNSGSSQDVYVLVCAHNNRMCEQVERAMRIMLNSLDAACREVGTAAAAIVAARSTKAGAKKRKAAGAGS